MKLVFRACTLITGTTHQIRICTNTFQNCILLCEYFYAMCVVSFAETCRCPKSISSAKILLPPLVNDNNLEILPDLLDKAITSCCGNCSGKHGLTHVNWDRDGSNSSSIKYSKQEALHAIAAGTNLALPIFRDSSEIEGDIEKSEYIVVPLLESKYLKIFSRTPTKKELGNAASAIISRFLWGQYPLLLISFVLTILAAILFWLFVSITYTKKICKTVPRNFGRRWCRVQKLPIEWTWTQDL